MTDILKTLKKAFTVSVAVITMVWSVGVSALLPTLAAAATTVDCDTLEAGDMIKSNGPDIWVLNQDMTRSYFSDGKLYKTWNANEDYSFNLVTSQCMASFRTAGAVLPRPGSMLVKELNSDTLYAVLPGNKLAEISADAAAKFYGSNYKTTRLYSVPTATWILFFKDGAQGAAVNATMPHEGMLVKNSGKYYYVAAGNVLKEVTATGLSANRIKVAYAYNLASTDGFTMGDAISAEVSALADRTQAMTGGTSTTPVVTGGSLRAALASSNPAAATLASGSLYNQVLNVTLSASDKAATVSGLTLTRSGYVANTNISGISVWDGMKRLGNIVTSLTSDGKATVLFGNDKIVIPANSSKTLAVAINLASGSYSGTVSFAIAAAGDVKTDGTVGGSFPLAGNTFSVVDGSQSLGDVRVDDVSVAGLTYSTIASATGNLEVGDTDHEVGKFSFFQANSKEAVQLEALTVYVEGTIQEGTDLKNWKLVGPNGAVLATADQSVNRYVTFILSAPYLIEKGVTRNFSVRVDTKDGSGRYFRASVQNDYDVLVRGTTTGAYILPTDGSGTSFDSSDTQNANGGFKIKQGALTISKSGTSPTLKLAPGAQNAVLAKFDLRSNGEELQLQKMHLRVNYAGTALTGTLIVRDAATGEAYLSVSADTANLQVATTTAPAYGGLLLQNFSSYLTIPSGQTKTLEVVGSVLSTATSSASYQVFLGGFYAKRSSTNDYSTLPDESSVSAGNSLSVQSVDLTVTKSASFGDTSRAPGSSATKIGQYALRASSADDINVNSINLGVTGYSKLQNLMLKNEATGVQIGSTVGSPSDSNSFSTNALKVTKDQTATIGVYADILAGQSGTVSTSIAAAGLSGFGANSNTNLSNVPATVVNGQAITLGSATLTIMRDGGSPSAKLVLAGSTNVELSKINLEAKKENLHLNKLTLQVNTASSTLGTTAQVAGNFSKIYVYDGNTLINQGGTEVDSSNGTVTLSGFDVLLTQDTQKVLSVRGDISGSGTLTPGSIAYVSVYSTSTDYLEVNSSQGLLSSNVTLTSGANSNNMLFTDAAPTITYTGTAGAVKTPNSLDTIGTYTIKNDGVRPITLSSIALSVSASGLGTAGRVTGFALYDTSDTQVGSTDTSIVSSTAANATATFSGLSEQIAANGGSKTYVLKANTSAIRTDLTSGQYAYLSTKIDGTKGYSANNATSELGWNDGAVTYSYTSINSNSALTGLNASESVPVTGSTYQY